MYTVFKAIISSLFWFRLGFEHFILLMYSSKYTFISFCWTTCISSTGKITVVLCISSHRQRLCTFEWYVCMHNQQINDLQISFERLCLYMCVLVLMCANGPCPSVFRPQDLCNREKTHLTSVTGWVKCVQRGIESFEKQNPPEDSFPISQDIRKRRCIQ